MFVCVFACKEKDEGGDKSLKSKTFQVFFSQSLKCRYILTKDIGKMTDSFSCPRKCVNPSANFYLR